MSDCVCKRYPHLRAGNDDFIGQLERMLEVVQARCENRKTTPYSVNHLREKLERTLAPDTPNSLRVFQDGRPDLLRSAVLSIGNPYTAAARGS